MGILDDAIRQHLDLKRRQGADQEELARLEDEAFGPPSRPGDPDFAERGSDGEQGGVSTSEGNGNGTAEALATEAPSTEAPAFHDQDIDETREESVETAPEAPAVEPGADEAEGAPTPPEEAAALAREPTVEHETLGGEGEEEDLDLDLDLEIEEEIEDVGELELDDEDADETVGGEPEAGAATATDEPIESLDTVEHHFEDAIDEAEVVEDEPEGPAGDSEDDEDVLEETPEFLRDAPEDDELWFEQGEPKDFDF